MISGSGWAWAWVRGGGGGGGNSLSYRRGRGQSGELMCGFILSWYGSKVVLLEQETDVEVALVFKK